MTNIMLQVKDMEDLLSSLKQESAELVVDWNENDKNQRKKKKKVVLDDEQKRNRSQSSWARSRVPMTSYMSKVNQLKKSDELESLDVDKGFNAVKTRFPVYSFPKNNSPRAEQLDLDLGDSDIPGPQKYNVNDNKLSTRKRTHTAFVTSEKREIFPTKDNSKPFNNQKEEEENESNSYEILEEERIISNGPSFPKAKRFAIDRPETEEKDDEVQPQRQALNIEHAEKALLPHTPGPIMRAKVSSSVVQKSQESIDLEAEPKLLPASSGFDVLSTRYRSPSVKIYHENQKAERKTDLETEIANQLRGPGYYSVDDKAIVFTKKGQGVATGTMIHKEPDHKKIAYAEVIKTAEKTLREIRGPGYYETEPSSPTKVPTLYKSESKPTKQIERKRYFEEKAALARDDFLDPNDAVVRKRVPFVNLAVNGSTRDRFSTPKENVQRDRSRSRSADFRRRKYNSFDEKYSNSRSNSRDRSYSESEDSQDAFRAWLQSSSTSPTRIGQKASRRIPSSSSLLALIPSRKLSYDIKYNAVEKRPTTGVSMKAEIQSREKTKEMQQNKPLIIETVKADEAANPQKQKFYGPQLPVPWVPDKAAMKIPNFYEKLKKKRKKRKGEVNDDDNYDGVDVDEDAAIADIMRLLGDESAPTTEKIEETDPYTDAFLKSSYSGSSIKRGNRIQLAEHSTDISKRRKKEKEIQYQQEQNQYEFLGPQLPLDWTKPDVLAATSTRYKQQISTVQFDKQTSRNKKKALGKGMMQEESFENYKIEPTDEMGPGKYDIMKHTDIAKVTAKGMIPFEKHISRKDQVGAHGERPISALENDHLDSAEELEYYGELDIDYGNAKDLAQGRHKQKGVPLYTKDRYPVEERVGEGDDEDGEGGGLDDHLGGSWFEGMAEQAKKKNNTHLDFSKMKGRKEEENDEELLNKIMKKEMHIEMEEKLDLEVNDHHPHKPRTAVVTFTDPKKHPRFPSEKAPLPERELTEEELQRREIRENPLAQGKTKNILNMEKMKGRDDDPHNPEEKEMLHELVHGEIDEEGAREVDKERTSGIEQAKEKRLKPVTRTIDFNKQLSSKRYQQQDDIDAERYLKEEIDEGGELVHEPEERDIHEKKTIGYTANQKNQINFQKMMKKSQQEEDLENKIMKEEIPENPEEEEVDIHPKKTEFLSNQKRVKGMVSFSKQGRETIPHEHSVQIDPDIPNDNILEKEGEVIDTKPIDAGNLRKGMHGFDNIPGKSNNMKQQINPRQANENPSIARQQYQDILQEEYGMTNPHDNPSQPAVILENNDKMKLKPRTPQVTSMKTNEPQIPFTKEKQQKLLQEEIHGEKDDQDPTYDGNRIQINPHKEGAAELVKSSKRPPMTSNENNNNGEQQQRGGQKTVTALQQKETRLSQPHEESIHAELEKEIGVSIDHPNRKNEGNTVILNEEKKDPLQSLKKTQKNTTIATMKNISNNQEYHEAAVIKDTPELQKEEVKLETRQELEEARKNRERAKRGGSGGVKPSYSGPTATRMNTEAEKKVIQDLEKGQREEVMIDDANVAKNPSRGGGGAGGVSGAVQAKATRVSSVTGKDMKEEIIMQSMINQSSDRELRRSLSKNENIASSEMILDHPEKPRGKAIPSAASLKQTTERTQSTNDQTILKEFTRDNTEELILNPKTLSSSASQKNVATMKNTETRIPTAQEDEVNKQLLRDTTEELIILPNQQKEETEGTAAGREGGGNSMRRNLSNISVMKSKSVKTLTPAESAAEKEFQKIIDTNKTSIDTSKRKEVTAGGKVLPSSSSAATLAGKKQNINKNSNSNLVKTPSMVSVGSKSKATPTSTNKTKQKTKTEGEKSIQQNEEDEPELLIIKTPAVNPPNVSSKPPQTKDSEQVNNLISQFNELDVSKGKDH